MLKVMDEVFLNKVQSDNINCLIDKCEKYVSRLQAGLLLDDNFLCDLTYHSIVDNALESHKMLSDCQLTKIVNVYYHITGT